MDDAKLRSLRSHARGVCYRMTGSIAEADDLAQEAMLRLVEQAPSEADDLRPWVTRVSLNLARDAYRRRRAHGYAGTWLPEPTADDEAVAFEPEHTTARYDLLESASIAFLVALEALSARQRAVLLLRDVLDYSVEETAAALATSAGAVKVTHHRARAAMAAYDSNHTRAGADARTTEAMQQFFLALGSGDVAAVEKLLAENAITTTDAAGEYIANVRTVVGANDVARFLLGIRRFHPTFLVGFGRLNGRPAIFWRSPDASGKVPPKGTVHLDVDDDGRVIGVYNVIASAKLARLENAFEEVCYASRT